MRGSPSFSVRETLLRRNGTSLYRAVRRGDDKPVIVAVGGPAREFDLVRGLSSPAVLKALERTTAEGMPALVLEDFAGVPLRTLLGRPLPIDRCLRIAIHVAEALGTLHDEGVIHKDVRPETILVDVEADTVKLIGFGIATRGASEDAGAPPANFVKGSLPYMAPEQSGRMNRPLDYRADFYSLGVTLYELLTGQLPFEANDPLEWVYCHVAREPVAPWLRVPELPPPVSAVVEKLLAKHADDRYWTARGLVADLRRCLDGWAASQEIESFALGEFDVSERLRMPDRLYGRHDELEGLLAAFHRVVATGVPELVLVSGYSGVGKSALVHELHRPIVREHGAFVMGKADQYWRAVPYSTIATALRDVVLETLSMSEAHVADLRRDLRTALGGNARVVLDVVPEAELLVGEQPPLAPLPPAESKHRFLTTFRALLGVFARQEHPLTLFLDDLQWADPASLELLQYVLTHPETKYLLAIGAYRDNEVSASHPLLGVIDDIRRTTTVSEIGLRPLSVEDVGELVADTVHAAGASSSLAELVHRKTQGNPFFARQFMSTLHRDGLLAFDGSRREWRWDVGQIAARDYTDNVVELMVRKVATLSEETRHVLRIAACIGTIADVHTLALISTRSEDGVHRALAAAVEQGLLLRIRDGYRFLHDGIQQAAHSLIGESELADFHLAIGRSLLASEGHENRLFDIANHYLRGVSALTTAERLPAAHLFLDAGLRAKAALAYRGAVTFLSAGVGLLGADSWQSAYELSFALRFELAECLWLTGDFEAMKRIVPVLLENARTTAERFRVRGLLVHVHTLENELEKAVGAGLEALEIVGVECGLHPTNDEVKRAYDRVWELLGDRPIESLLDLPEMTDADMCAAFDLVASLYSPAYFTDWNLFCLLGCFAVSSSLRHGNAPSSFIGCAVFALTLTAEYRRYDDGYRFGQVAYASLDRPGVKRFVAKICEVIGAGCNSWVRPFRSALAYLERGATEGLEIGDLIWGPYCESHATRTLFAAGEPLDELYRRSERSLDYMRRAKYDDFVALHARIQRLLRRLTGAEPAVGDVAGDPEDLAVFTGEILAVQRLRNECIFGDYERALQTGLEARRHYVFIRGLIEDAEFRFYDALTLAAVRNETPEPLRRTHDAWLSEHESRYLEWARSCPENFAARHALIAAETARLSGREVEAETGYEQAITLARNAGFLHVEAIANEIAARFHAGRGLASIAKMYLGQARDAYRRWGADGKVHDLERRHPDLRERMDATFSIAVRPEQVDLIGVIKASQTISGELDLDRLTERLIEAVLEQSGADLGRLVLLRDEALKVESEAMAIEQGLEARRISLPVEGSGLVPESVVNYVRRTRQTVMLSDATAPGGQGRFLTDSYFVRVRPKSVLCVPIVRGAQVAGVLYLENKLVSHAFTPERVGSVELIASQAAITVEAAFWLRQERDARLALERSESRFRRLSDSKLLGIVVADTRGHIFEANDQFLEMLGYTRSELAAGKIDWKTITPPEYGPLDQNAIHEIGASGVCRPYEKEFIRKDGMRVPALVGAAHLVGPDLSVAYVLDISVRRRAEKERDRLLVEEQKARAQAEAALRARDEFMSIAAHELRTPLTPLKMQIDVLTRMARSALPAGAPGSAELLKILEASNGQLGRLVTLIGELLDVSTIRAGHMMLAIESFDLVDLVRDVVSDYRINLEAAGCSVNLRTASELRGRWDRVRIEQVVSNLLTNAMKYGSGKPIDVEVIEDAGLAKLTVRDNGIGIDETDRDRIFERFERAVPVRHFGGFGLGLYVTREIVRAHNGTIDIESQRGIGSAFIVRLPIQPPEASPESVLDD